MYFLEWKLSVSKGANNNNFLIGDWDRVKVGGNWIYILGEVWFLLAPLLCHYASIVLKMVPYEYHIYIYRLWFESSSQQRKTTCLLLIRKSLACARALKLTTTNVYRNMVHSENHLTLCQKSWIFMPRPGSHRTQYDWCGPCFFPSGGHQGVYFADGKHRCQDLVIYAQVNPSMIG